MREEVKGEVGSIRSSEADGSVIAVYCRGQTEGRQYSKWGNDTPRWPPNW